MPQLPGPPSERDDADDPLANLIDRFEEGLESGEPAFLSEDELDELLEYYESREDYENSLAVAEQGIGQFKFSPEYYLAKANSLVYLGRIEETIEALDQAAGYSPGNPDVELMRIDLLLDEERIDDALELINDLLDRSLDDNQRTHALFQRSEIYRLERKFGAMLEDLKEALRIDPRYDAALQMLVYVGDPFRVGQQAREILEQLIDDDPYYDAAWYYLGIACEQAGEDERALEAYDYAVTIQPDDPRYIESYAQFLFYLGKFRPALDQYIDLITRFDPKDPMVYLRTGEAYKQLESYKYAREMYRRAIILLPEYVEPYTQIADTFMLEGKFHQAVAYYEKAMLIDEIGPAESLGYALANRALNDASKAEKAFQLAIRYNPGAGDYYIHYALFQLDLGRERDAFRTLEEAYDNADMSAILIYGEVVVRLLAHRRRAALLRLREAVARYPQDVELLYHWNAELRDDLEVGQIVMGN